MAPPWSPWQARAPREETETESKLLFKLARQGKSLPLTVGNEPPLALTPQSETRFQLHPLNSRVTFEKDAQGRGNRLTLEQPGKPTVAERRQGTGVPGV